MWKQTDLNQLKVDSYQPESYEYENKQRQDMCVDNGGKVTVQEPCCVKHNLQYTKVLMLVSVSQL